MNKKSIILEKEDNILDTIKVLILTANPSNSDRLRLEQEVREITAELERAKLRDSFSLIHKGAVRVPDLARALLQTEPAIVHFSGHGTGEPGLVLEDDAGQAKLVPTAALVELFRLYRNTVKAVFLNACYSDVQAEAIYQQIDCVIGMNQAIGDKTAIQFAPKFYAALAQGCSFQTAFDYAKAVLQLDSNPEIATPILKIRQAAANLFPAIQAAVPTTTQPLIEPSPIASPPAPHYSQSFGNLSFAGSSNILNAVQGSKVSLSQTIGQPSLPQPHAQFAPRFNIDTAIAALEQLKQALYSTDLRSFKKRSLQVPIEEIIAELQKPRTDQALVEAAIADLEQGLADTAALSAPLAEVIQELRRAHQ